MDTYGETITFETVRMILDHDFKERGEDLFHKFLSYGCLVYEDGNGFLINLSLSCGRTKAILTSTFIGDGNGL